MEGSSTPMSEHQNIRAHHDQQRLVNPRQQTDSKHGGAVNQVEVHMPQRSQSTHCCKQPLGVG